MPFPANIKAKARPNFVQPEAGQERVRVPTIASPVASKDRRTLLKEKLQKGIVEWSPDLKRIVELPRRAQPDLEKIAEELTARLKTPEGTMKLRPIQAWVLHEAPLVNGLIGNISVGSGKELCGLLMPMVMPPPVREDGSKEPLRAVLFIPPALRAQLFERDWEFYGKHWRLPNLAGGSKFVPGRPVLHVVAYSELSNTKASRLLENINPDLIICNEMQNLKHKTAARTKRFLRHYADHHHTRLVGWTGTLITNSIKNAAHLCALALDENSPMPLHPPTVEEWASALDPHDFYYNPGALRNLCEKGEDIRRGFRRRLTDTQGFISTPDNQLGTSLIFYERKAPELPQTIKDSLTKLRRNPEIGGWVRPDGEEFRDSLRVVECARQLACGFYYFWAYPKGESEELITEWFQRRQSWNRELRQKLKLAQPFLDSDKLCENAAARFVDGGCVGCLRGPREPHSRGCPESEEHPLWESRTYEAWHEIEDKVYHEQRVKWESDYLLEDVKEWANEKPGIVWVEHAATGHRLEKLTGLRYYGGGEKSNSEIIQENGKRSIIVSIDAHHFGKNLQGAFWRNLILTVSSDAAQLEQLIGRTHREGQPEDEVEVHLYQHTAELKNSLENARTKARFLNDVLGSPQKLVYGSWAQEETKRKK